MLNSDAEPKGVTGKVFGKPASGSTTAAAGRGQRRLRAVLSAIDPSAALLGLFLVSMPGVVSAQAPDQDLQLWSMGRVTHLFQERWSTSFQFEIRLKDDISAVDERIYKLYAHHNFSPRVGLSFGLKYIDRPDDNNEWEPWQELVLPRRYKEFHLSHQVRLEERFIQTIDGVLPRVRYLLNWSRGLGDSPRYLTGFGAVRFNFMEKGAGPVAGFEQVRAYFGLGFFKGAHTRLEIGYLYRFEVKRDAPNLSDHAIHLQLLFGTHHRVLLRPLPDDFIR